MKITTNDFNDFNINMQWKNNRTDQGTISAEIQVLYSFFKNKYETYFINDSPSSFRIFWWTELDDNQKILLSTTIKDIYKNEFLNINTEIELKKNIHQSENFKKQNSNRIADSIFLASEKEKEKINILNRRIKDSINNYKKRIQDSLENVKKIEELKYIKNLKIGDEFKSGFVIFKSDDNMHGLVVSKKEILISLVDFIKKANFEFIKSEYGNQIQRDNLNIHALLKIINEEALLKNIFSDYNGFKVPSLVHMTKIREAFYSNDLFNNIIKSSQSDYKGYPWVCLDEKEWYHINPFISKIFFLTAIKSINNHKIKNLDLIKEQNMGLIVRLVHEF
jgi:hypothetical protein